MSKLLCAKCNKHPATIHPVYGPVWCDWCSGKTKGVSKNSNIYISHAPPKGSPEWFKGKWFRRSEKEWHDDIRSRVASPDGKIVRRVKWTN